MKKARTTSNSVTVPVSPVADAPIEPPPRRSGLGRLGQQSLGRPTVIPSLVFFPVSAPRPGATSRPAKKAAAAFAPPVPDLVPDDTALPGDAMAMLKSLRDELDALLESFAEPPPYPLP